MLNLPVELWAKILRYLDSASLLRVAGVCSQLRVLAQPLLWRDLEDRPWVRTMVSKVSKDVWCRHLLQLVRVWTFHAGTTVDSRCCSRIARFTSHLVHLFIELDTLTEYDLPKAAPGILLHSLTFLRLKGLNNFILKWLQTINSPKLLTLQLHVWHFDKPDPILQAVGRKH